MLPDRKSSCVGKTAFSLLEVVISLGIISFAFIAIIALFPLGMKSNHNSTEESRGLNLLQTMVADWQVTAWSTNSLNSHIYNLPPLTGITTTTSNGSTPLYVAEDGSTNSTASMAFYRVTYTIYPASGYMQPTLVDLTASWPAAATNAPSNVEILSTFLP